MVAQLTLQETADLMQKVLDLGYNRLKSHTDFCSTPSTGGSKNYCASWRASAE